MTNKRVLIIGANPLGTERPSKAADMAMIAGYPVTLAFAGHTADVVQFLPDMSCDADLAQILTNRDYDYVALGLGIRTLPAFLNAFTFAVNTIHTKAPTATFLFPPSFEGLAHEVIELIDADRRQP